MTTDELRHLLEMAAKACGIEIEQCTCTDVPFRRKDNRQHWTPDTDDGDSARMRSALGICVNWIWYAMNGEHKCVGVECGYPFSRAIDVYLKDHNNDRNAALRLCALKVAAMIGEGMG